MMFTKKLIFRRSKFQWPFGVGFGVHFDEVPRRIFETLGSKMSKKTGKCILQHRKWNPEPRNGCWKLENGTQMLEMVPEDRRATDPRYNMHSYQPVSPRSPGKTLLKYIDRLEIKARQRRAQEVLAWRFCCGRGEGESSETHVQ